MHFDGEVSCDFSYLTPHFSMTGMAAGDFETPDSKIAGGLMKFFDGDFRKRGLITEDEKPQHQSMFRTGRHIAWTIFERVKISDSDGTVLDLSELENDHVQSFDTRWDDTVFSTREQPDDEVLEYLFFRQLDKGDQLKQLRAFYIQDIVQKKLQRMVGRYLDQDTQENHFLVTDRVNKTHQLCRHLKRKGKGKGVPLRPK